MGNNHYSSYFEERKSPRARYCFKTVIIIIFILTSVVGCGRAVNRAAERRIRDLLPDLLGSARLYRVHVQGDETDTVHGRLDAVTVEGDDVQLSNGLLVDRLHIDMSHVVVDMDKRTLRSIQSAHFTAVFGEATLDEFLAGEAPEGETLRNVRISLRQGSVAISGERVVLGVGVPFRAYGPLRVLGPHKLEIDPNRLVVVGIPVTGAPLRYLKRKFESAIDLSNLSVPVSIETVRTENGKLILSGTPDIQIMLRMHAAEGTP